MQYIGLFLWIFAFGICGFGYDFFLITLIACVGYPIVYLFKVFLSWLFPHLYYQWLKKHNPKKYKQEQNSKPYSRHCLEMAKRAKTEKERNEWLDKAEL